MLVYALGSLLKVIFNQSKQISDLGKYKSSGLEC